MDVGRARVLAAAGLMVGTLLAISAGPAAGAECSLSAPSYVNVGTPVTIEGEGFPASSDIDISVSIEGGASDAFSIQSNAGGTLAIALTPEAIDIGVTTIAATAGSVCTAQVTYTVLASGQTPPPATPTPDDSALGSAPGAPQTDANEPGGIAEGQGTPPWMLALWLVGAGIAGLLLTRSTRRS
jgi:hypothetical protein